MTVRIHCQDCNKELWVETRHTLLCKKCRRIRNSQHASRRNMATVSRSRKKPTRLEKDLHEYGMDNKPFKGRIYHKSNILHMPADRAAQVINDILAGKALYAG